ncbi:MAG: YHYH protein [Pedosphaera sp.]|nr:YHYH protein [Pedosphaera sp.]
MKTDLAARTNDFPLSQGRRMMNAVAIIMGAAFTLLFSLPAAAHEWQRHDDPQLASAPFLSPYATGPKPGAVKLLASAKGFPAAGSDVGAKASLSLAPSFAPITLGAANLYAQTFLKFNPSVRFWWDTTSFHVESDSIPAHNLMEGISSWQRQIPIPIYYFGTNAWCLPLYPVPANTPYLITPTTFTRGAIALAANGIPIFNPYNNTGRASALIGELDQFGGHCGRADDYHYHVAPLHLTNLLGFALPVAFALDGYPIYGLTEPTGRQLQIWILSTVTRMAPAATTIMRASAYRISTPAFTARSPTSVARWTRNRQPVAFDPLARLSPARSSRSSRTSRRINSRCSSACRPTRRS